MKRLSLYVILPVLVTGLSACQIYLDATLFNNAGQNVRMDHPVITVAPNQFAHFIYPNERTDRVFRLQIGGCVYLYEVPKSLDNYHLPDFKFRTGRGVQIQVEKDFSVNLLPPLYDGDTPASGATILLHEGFPLHPLNKTCPAEMAR
jgi:hypothetical protein